MKCKRIVENGFRKLSHADKAAKTEETLQTNMLAESAKKYTFFSRFVVLLLLFDVLNACWFVV